MPKIIVNGRFLAHMNNLTTLEGLPKNIEFRDTVDVGNNQLTTLKGLPDRLMGSLFCGTNGLRDLEGCPRYINRGFDCSENEFEDAEAFKNGPDRVGGDYTYIPYTYAFEPTKEDITTVTDVGGVIILSIEDLLGIR